MDGLERASRLEVGLDGWDGGIRGNKYIHLGKFPYRCAELLLNIADTAIEQIVGSVYWGFDQQIRDVVKSFAFACAK